MDALELLLRLVIAWRIGLAVLGAGMLAFVLSGLIPGFGGVAGIVFVLLGFGAGALWQIAYERSQNERPSPGQH